MKCQPPFTTLSRSGLLVCQCSSGRLLDGLSLFHLVLPRPSAWFFTFYYGISFSVQGLAARRRRVERGKEGVGGHPRAPGHGNASPRHPLLSQYYWVQDVGRSLTIAMCPNIITCH